MQPLLFHTGLSPWSARSTCDIELGTGGALPAALETAPGRAALPGPGQGHALETLLQQKHREGELAEGL